MQIVNLGNCAIQISGARTKYDGEEDDELLEGDWKDITMEDFDRLYKLLQS